HTRFSRDWSSDVCSSDLILDLLAYRDGRAESTGIDSTRVLSEPIARRGLHPDAAPKQVRAQSIRAPDVRDNVRVHPVGYAHHARHYISISSHGGHALTSPTRTTSSDPWHAPSGPTRACPRYSKSEMDTSGSLDFDHALRQQCAPKRTAHASYS